MSEEKKSSIITQEIDDNNSSVVISRKEYNQLKKGKTLVVDAVNESLSTVIILIKRRLIKELVGCDDYVKMVLPLRIFQGLCLKFRKYGIYENDWTKKNGVFRLRICADCFLKIFKKCYKICNTPAGPVVVLPENLELIFTKRKGRRVI